MLRRFMAATAIAGIALGSALVATPAFAGKHHHGGDEQVNINVQDGAVICNSNSAEGLIALNIPVLNYNETGHCGNVAANTNVDVDDHHHKGGHGHHKGGHDYH
ncbi:hypothetical protein [Nocardiopsis algeriensis]|uniref:Small secreted domain DUF320 n=1 Tax=Nocardiopsis algeriensis TaxID=1478215 RepID=A0A841IQL0_9ACTN|nr:hypothetical protein [Nocardiopsis algeriensis]MBB6120977.1 hypothetical protein [Nocardiopsis algeriensis]